MSSELVRMAFSSTPQLAAGERGALRQRFELGPGDVGMHAPAKTAICGGDDPLPAHQSGKPKDALGDELGMLDHIGGVADDTGEDQLPVGELYVLPHLPFVRVSDVAGLERVGA